MKDIGNALVVKKSISNPFDEDGNIINDSLGG